MADVGREAGDRGQLLLVAGITLAVVLVALVVVLNSAIYTENLATRHETSDIIDASTFRAEVVESTGETIYSVNVQYGDAGYPTLETEFGAAMADIDRLNARGAGARARVDRIAVATDGDGTDLVERGTRIADEDAASTFTPRDNAPVDWHVASEVRARQLQLNVTGISASVSDSTVADELDDGTWTEGSFFYVDVDDGEWRMAVYEDSGSNDVHVGVYDDDTGTYSVCSATPASTPVRVDIGRATVDGEYCRALSNVSKQVGPYDIHYANGDQATGTYELVVDRVVSGPTGEAGPASDGADRTNHDAFCHGPTYYAADAGSSPYVAPALYSSTVDATFRSQSVEYEGTLRVAPDELSKGAMSPRFSSLTINDQSDSGLSNPVRFQVDWEVADPDGDLDSVTVELIDSGSLVNSTTESSIGGQTATGTLVIENDQSLPYEYNVSVTVEDADGNVRSVDRRHQAEDGGDDGGCPP